MIKPGGTPGFIGRVYKKVVCAFTLGQFGKEEVKNLHTQVKKRLQVAKAKGSKNEQVFFGCSPVGRPGFCLVANHSGRGRGVNIDSTSHPLGEAKH